MLDKRNFFSPSEKTKDQISGYNVKVVIPWRATPKRLGLYNFLVAWYSKEFPEFEIISSDRESSEIFNLSASRNDGMRTAFASGADVVLVSDADFFVSKDTVIDSINNSMTNNTISIPYTMYREFRMQKQTNLMLFDRDRRCLRQASRDLFPPKTLSDRLTPCSGNFVIPRQVFEDIDGFDENFVGWGYEDEAYHKKYIARYGKLFDYIPGLGLSMPHSGKLTTTLGQNKAYFEENY